MLPVGHVSIAAHNLFQSRRRCRCQSARYRPTVRQFSPAHVAALLALTAACGASILVPRRHPGAWVWGAARLLAGVIVAGWASEYVAEVIVGTWSLDYSLPLQLTDAVSVAAILALLTRRQLFIDLLYFWAFSASVQAALTPDLAPGQSFVCGKTGGLAAS